MEINGIFWRVLLVSPNHPGLLKSNNSFALGVCDNNIKVIYINDELEPQKLKKVLCHEITHASMFSYGVNLTIEQEEIVADLLATYGEEIIEITNSIFSRLIYK